MADETKEPTFSFEKVAEYTGKVQYRVNDMASIETPVGPFLRGEVKNIKTQLTADKLVRGGLFAHVPADTAVGQPEQYKLKKTKPAQEPAADQPPAAEPFTPFERPTEPTDNEV